MNFCVSLIECSFWVKFFKISKIVFSLKPMIHGIGIDLCSSERIEKVFARFGLKFAKRILSNGEFIAFSNKLKDSNSSKSQLFFKNSREFERAESSNNNCTFAINLSFNIKSLENFLAKRFAAKEAFAKALGFGIGRAVNFCDIEIANDSSGKPIISLPGKPKNFLNGLLNCENYQIFLSLSDETKPTKAALAMVVIEKF